MAADSQLHALVLIIEASSSAGSVALLRGADVLARQDVPMGASREDALFPAVQALLTARCDVRDLTAVVCGAGPGSFTSLRIAGSVAKGFAHALAIPLFAVPSLLLAAAARTEPGEYVVHSDALRGEQYVMAATIDAGGVVHAAGDLQLVDNTDLNQLAGGREILRVPKSGLLATAHDVLPDAARLNRLAAWLQSAPVSLSEWEPRYGRLAEAQVKWEAAHGRPLDAA